MENNTLNIEQIKALLPHRYPFLLVDKVMAYKPYDSLTAIKSITYNEPCLQGHFPQKTIYPGVLIIESMAQAAALLGCISFEELPPQSHESFLYYLVGVDKVRFKKSVYPGEHITLQATFIRRKQGMWWFSVKTFVDDTFISSANIITTVVVADKL